MAHSNKRRTGEHPAHIVDLRTAPHATIRLYYFTGKAWGLKALWEKRLKVSTYAEANDPFELLPFERRTKNERRAVEQALEKLDGAGTGVLCFSDAWTNSVMWSHYAEKHAGMCLGFDVPISNATKIEYVDEPIRMPGSRKLAKGEVTAALATKPGAWRHEREWQLHVQLRQVVDGLYFRSFDDELHLREVILGSTCPLVPLEVVEAVTNPPLDVEIFKARPSQRSFDVCRHEKIETHTSGGYRSALLNARTIFADELPDT